MKVAIVAINVYVRDLLLGNFISQILGPLFINFHNVIFILSAIMTL